MKIRLHHFLILISFSSCLFAQEAPSTWQKIKERGEIVWGADIQGGEPYVYEDPKNPSHLIGFEVDIVEELAKRLGVKHRFKQTAWSNLVPSLERQDFDVALNGIEATTERQERGLLSRPYFIYAETLAVKRGSPYKNLDDLKGKKIATLNQTYAYDLLLEKGFDPSSYGGIYEGVQEPYLDLKNGKVDGVLLDNIIADRYGCTMKEIECLPDEVARGVYIVLMRKADKDLKKAIDGALEEMEKDGTLEQILRRWNLWDKRQKEPIPLMKKVSRERHLTLAQFGLFLRGALMTLRLSISAFLIAVPFGFLLATGRVYGRTGTRFLSTTYIEIFRGTPVLLQLYVLYFGIAPIIKLGAISACVLGLGLNYAAYEAEIYRGALLAIPRGQSEAASSLGLSHWQTLRYVLIPQAFRVALPPMTNDFIALLKDSSLVGVIAVVELTKRMTIAAVDMRGWFIPGLVCASLYFLMSFPLARYARTLEKRLHHDQHPRPL